MKTAAVSEQVSEELKSSAPLTGRTYYTRRRDVDLADHRRTARLQLDSLFYPCFFVVLQEQQKYAQLQEIIKKLDEEKKRGDSLLYAMIPKAVADRLRKGITALETCQVHEAAA